MIMEEYIPAIITAITGILGVIINVFVNIWYRHNDIHEKQKETHILAYETFYVPLAMKLLVFQNCINNLDNKMNKLDLSVICDYLCKDNAPAELRTNVRDLYEAAKYINEFVNNNSFKFIKDYKTKHYYDKVINCVIALCRAKENQESYTNIVFQRDDIQKLIEHIDKNSIIIFSSNIFYTIYLRRWNTKNK